MSDDDLIRRGDAKGCMPAHWFHAPVYQNSAIAAIDAIPAAQVTVKPLRYITPDGETLDQMREHARQDPLAKQGDMKLVWVNEGDLYNHTLSAMPVTEIAPHDPANVQALVEAAEQMLGKIDTVCLIERDHPQADLADAWRELRAALAAWKDKR